MSSKLIIGTAQFGSDYGIKHDGQPSLKEIEKIVRVAWDGGITVLHGGDQYGLSDEVLQVLSSKDFKWIWKNKSNPIYFRFEDKLGCSIYDISEIPPDVDLKIVQLSVNILTPNLNQIRKLKGLKFEIHARSVFLQGLLLMEELPKWISDEARIQIEQFRWACRNIYIDGLFKTLQPYEAALGYVLGLDEIDKVIIGVNSAKQLEQLLQVKPLKSDYDFSITDENVLDPRRWPKA